MHVYSCQSNVSKDLYIYNYDVSVAVSVLAGTEYVVVQTFSHLLLVSFALISEERDELFLITELHHRPVF